jgi:hypothetical protein
MWGAPPPECSLGDGDLGAAYLWPGGWVGQGGAVGRLKAQHSQAAARTKGGARLCCRALLE